MRSVTTSGDPWVDLLLAWWVWALNEADQQERRRMRAKEVEMIPDHEIVRVLTRVAHDNPDALRLAAQLLGVPPCPKCDYVMRPGRVCRVCALGRP